MHLPPRFNVKDRALALAPTRASLFGCAQFDDAGMSKDTPAPVRVDEQAADNGMDGG